jgi:hypothetical protein
MYKKFMELIEESADDIAKNIVQTAYNNEEFSQYRGIPDDILTERVYQVIRNVYERLGNWLDKNKSKNTLFAYYSDLGSQRMREGIPLEEVIKLYQLIKREIWHAFREDLSVNDDFELKRLMEIDFYVDLFFDRIVTAIISGYQREQAKTAANAPTHQEKLP